MVSLSASSLSFGSQPVAITNAPVAVFFTNSGSSALKINSLTITGGDAKSFGQTSSCGSSVAAGRICKIAILFTPAASGARSAALTITDNSPDSPQRIALAGTGLHDVVLAWTPSLSTSIGGYIIVRSAGDRLNAQIFSATPMAGTTYVDTNVEPGHTYQYWIISVSPDGITLSPDSPEASATVPSP
jgi:hypothetical protein